MKKRRRTSQSTSVTSDTKRAKRRRLTKLIDDSQRAEYDSRIDSQDVTLQSLADLSAADFQSISESTGSTKASIDFEFSKPALKVLKRNVSDEDHWSEHQSDYEGTLNCHKFSTTNITKKVGKNYYQLLPSPNLLLSILYLALNHHESELQISDLMNLCNNHTISMNDTKRFFPEGIDSNDLKKITKPFMLSCIHKKVVENLTVRCINIAKLIHYKFKAPNLVQLCKRYCFELALPDEIFVLVERLIQLKPPEFQQRDTHFSYFEGRAIAYIIFVLKLLFGLNGVTEVKISNSATKINQLEPNSIKLFDFVRWMEYIEIRKQLIMKVHAPSRLSQQENSQNSTVHYLHMFQKARNGFDESEDEENPPNKRTEKKYLKAQRPKINYFNDLTNQLLANIPEVTVDSELMDFPHSLTPFASYLQEIKNRRSDLVPERLYESFAGDNVLAFIKPLRLRLALAEKNVALKVKKAPINKNVRYEKLWEDVNYLEKNKYSNNYKYVKVKAKGDETEWEAKVKEEAVNEENRIKLEVERIHESLKQDFDQIKEETEMRTEEAKKNRQRKRWANRAVTEIHSDEETTTNARYFLIESDTDDENLTTEKDFDTKVTLIAPNFDYWMYFYTKRQDSRDHNELQKKFPDIFNWLLDECANVVGLKSYTLFHELQTIETIFNYHMQPLVPGKAPKYRNIDELQRTVRTAVRNCVNRW